MKLHFQTHSQASVVKRNFQRRAFKVFDQTDQFLLCITFYVLKTFFKLLDGFN
jgi:hypothetical protein